ncbi:hypothetical protein FGO68_gene7677 [Halteria grandinella]|uniref:Uncharacterized protein n=1 Tax=Halteria grandinella TaxID=5974 RepID=A0A8J8P2G7_HALGN|nr:hypothetical protein FGO68_gene7677 [Halteria grandinella]
MQLLMLIIHYLRNHLHYHLLGSLKGDRCFSLFRAKPRCLMFYHSLERLAYFRIWRIRADNEEEPDQYLAPCTNLPQETSQRPLQPASSHSHPPHLPSSLHLPLPFQFSFSIPSLLLKGHSVSTRHSGRPRI